MSGKNIPFSDTVYIATCDIETALIKNSSEIWKSTFPSKTIGVSINEII